MGIQNTAFQVGPQVSPGDPEPLCPLSVAALGLGAASSGQPQAYTASVKVEIKNQSGLKGKP